MRFAYLKSRGNLKEEKRLNQKSYEKEQPLKHSFLHHIVRRKTKTKIKEEEDMKTP